MTKIHDLTGQRFGKLTVLEHKGSTVYTGHVTPMWLCKCDCGCEVYASSRQLRASVLKSCGCLKGRPGTAGSNTLEKSEGLVRKDVVREKDRLKNVYRFMISRCYDPDAKGYKKLRWPRNTCM